MSSQNDARLDPVWKQYDTTTLKGFFERKLPAEAILSSAEELRPFECDGLSAYQEQPNLVLLPADRAEVVEIIRICQAHNIALVPRGAGTGLSGGALPLPGGVMIALSRMNRIISIDPATQLARVQPGVRNLAISEAAAGFGLYYAPDPSSQIACSIGGNVAENAGGVHCLKYGLTVHNVQALECVLADGEVVRLGSDCLDAPGFDLLALLHGSEGMLALVTEVTVKLLPKPACTRVMMISFDSVELAAEAVADVIASGIVPAGLEMMDRLAIQAAEDFVHAGYPRDVEAILLCELDGPEREVKQHMAVLESLFSRSGALSVRTAQDQTERDRFWAGRKSAFPAVGRLSPDYYCMDGTIPRKNLPQVLKGIAELSTQYGLPVANVFHAGDGNLHPLILFDANHAGELEKAEKMGGDILQLCVRLGGTITGEHGVGREKINQMCVQFGQAELEQFHATKRAFDSSGILNPNKNIPTLARCAEFGMMHVHHGELPFPDLERF